MPSRGQLAAGDVVVLALLLTRLYAPLTALANARVDIMSALVSFDRVFEILDLKPLIQEKPDAVAIPARPACRVEFDDVRFAYPSADKVSLASLEDVATLDTRGGEEVLHGISFRVEPGQTVALVGSSGAGKSTIAQLLSRLYDVDSGAVRFGGRPTCGTSSFDSLRQTIGMVTQDGHLFHEMHRAPTCAWPGRTPPTSRSGTCCAAPGSRTMIRVPAGRPGHGGGGARLPALRRRTAAADHCPAAAWRSRAVVILDEATAALDSTNEAAVQAALGEALKGRTAVVIAHRLSTIRSADAILVVEGGHDRGARHPRGAARRRGPLRGAARHAVRPGRCRRRGCRRDGGRHRHQIAPARTSR